MKNLVNRYGEWALITGASSGIGKAFVYELAARGLNVILTARREEKLNNIREDLANNYGINAVTVPADLSRKKGIESLLNACEGYNIGILVSNAGLGKIGPFDGISDEFIENMVNVNCLSSALLINYFIKQMIRNQRGAIINISSVMAELPLSYASLYSATKGFNLAFGKALYYELKQQNVDILTVLPGSTATEFDGFGNKIANSKQRSVEQVVNTSLNALGKKPLVVDGIKNKFNVVLSRIIPTTLLLKITGKVSADLYSKAISSNRSE